MLIDMIKENTKMVNVPSFTANTTDPRIFVTEQIQPSANPCFFYVPYCLGHINYCDLDSPERNVISSKFSGCLMVIWQEAEGYPIRIGHVDTAAGSSRKTAAKGLSPDILRRMLRISPDLTKFLRKICRLF